MWALGQEPPGTNEGRTTAPGWRNSDWTKKADRPTLATPMDARTDAPAGSTPRRGPVRLLPWALGVGIAAAVVYGWTQGGGLSHRSVVDLDEVVPLGQDIETVRIEIQNGTVTLSVPSADGAGDGQIAYRGGVRRAADTAEELARIEQIPFRLQAETDAQRPRTLVLRGPRLPSESSALLALELGIRMPSALALEIAVAGNGHVTVGHRTGRTTVETGRGDLRFEGVGGPVQAQTGRGNVIAFDHRGDLDLETRVGDMQAFVREPGVLLRLVSGKGTVQCGVPPDTEFELDARAEIGRIGADFGLEAEVVGSYGAALVGARGSGRTKVVMRTGSGHIAFRAKPFD